MTKQNSIDYLWDKEAADLSNEDIDAIIAHQLMLLRSYESGVKPKRDIEESIDWTKVVSAIAGKAAPKEEAKKPKFKRRI